MDPAEMHNLVTPVLDRVVAPVVKAMENMDARWTQAIRDINVKLDAAAGIGHQVAAADQRADRLETHIAEVREEAKTEIDKINANLVTLTAETYKTAGRNQVIVWVLALVGAPTTVALILAGISKLFGIKMGM